MILQVLLALDNPSGNIAGTLKRKPSAKLWGRGQLIPLYHMNNHISIKIKKMTKKLNLLFFGWEKSTVYCKSWIHIFKLQCNVGHIHWSYTHFHTFISETMLKAPQVRTYKSVSVYTRRYLQVKTPQPRYSRCARKQGMLRIVFENGQKTKMHAMILL